MFSSLKHTIKLVSKDMVMLNQVYAYRNLDIYGYGFFFSEMARIVFFFFFCGFSIYIHTKTII